MITRFRIEASGQTRDEVLESLRHATNQLLVLSVKAGTKLDQWEVTQEVISLEAGVYNGRVVMKLKAE